MIASAILNFPTHKVTPLLGASCVVLFKNKLCNSRETLPPKNWSLLGTKAKNNLHCNGKSAGKWRHKFTATAASAHGRNPIRMAKVEKGRKSKRGKKEEEVGVESAS